MGVVKRWWKNYLLLSFNVPCSIYWAQEGAVRVVESDYSTQNRLKGIVHSQCTVRPLRCKRLAGGKVKAVWVWKSHSHRATRATAAASDSFKVTPKTAHIPSHPMNKLQPPSPPAQQLLPPPPLSDYSTAGVKNSAWASSDFLLGAGMVIIQRRTHLVVVVHDTQQQDWFFLWERKNIGESLEQAAIREAYEEMNFI